MRKKGDGRENERERKREGKKEDEEREDVKNTNLLLAVLLLV